MKKLVPLGLLVCAILVFDYASAQVSLSRQVIGAAGNSVNISSQTNLSQTIGETVVTTESNTGITFTQGFHQPGALGTLAYGVETTQTTCVNSSDGMATVVNLQGCSPPYAVEWSNGATGNTAYNLSAGMYSVTVSTAACEVVHEFEILAGEEASCDIVFLNAFSPNGDGVNDVWDIENIEDTLYQDNHIEIYNRWGQLVWEGSNYNNGSVVWKGLEKNGNDLSDGTYFYLAKIAERNFKGYIEITR